MDITQLILDDHHEQRRLFAIIEQIDRTNTDALTAMWTRLSALLEVHAEAEEKHFYPELLKLGKGAGEKDNAEDETEDAISDHNDIRDAVAAANEANGDHMAEEEREALTDFRRNVSLQLRHDLAVSFAAFEADHVTGVKAVDKDPQEYIDENE